MKYCYYCGRELEDEAKFCDYCGAKLDEDEEVFSEESNEEQSAVKICPGCGKANVIDAVCCQNCGTKVDQEMFGQAASAAENSEQASEKKLFSKKSKIAIASLSSALVVVLGVIIFFAAYECPHKHTEMVRGFAATCTTDGKTHGFCCSKCGEMVIEQKVIPGSHEYVENVIKESTCTQTGEKKKTCKVCGDVKTETISSSHSFVRTGEFKECSDCGLITAPDFVGDTWYTCTEYEWLGCQNCLFIPDAVWPVKDSMHVWFYPVCKHCNTVSASRIWSATVSYSNPYLYYLYCLECEKTTVVRIEVSY